MKTSAWVAAFSALVLAPFILMLAGCQPEAVSIKDRISDFIADLNTQDRTNVYKNFDKDSTTQYAQIAAPTFWDHDFPIPSPSESYSIANLNDSNPSNVSGIISGPTTFGLPTNIYFMMSKDGDDWYIQKLDFTGDFVNPVVKSLW